MNHQPQKSQNLKLTSFSSTVVEHLTHHPKVEDSSLATVLATSGLYYKSFTIVIYDRNDSGQYHKTIML
jgi:hypothetical protein